MAPDSVFTTLQFIRNLLKGQDRVFAPCQPSVMKHSSLSKKFVSYEESVANTAPDLYICTVIAIKYSFEF